MKYLINILSLVFVLLVMVSQPGTAQATSYGELREEAYGDSSDVLGMFMETAGAVDGLSGNSEQTLDLRDEYSGLMASYELAAGSDPVGAILGRFPVVDRSFVENYRTADDGAAREILAGTVNEGTILGLIVARSPVISRAETSWRASLERYPQTVFLLDLLSGYQAITEGMSLGVGSENQQGMVQMNHSDAGMLTLRGQIVELDIETAWNEYLRDGINVIADAKVLLAEIRHKDEMIAINTASVSRLSVLNNVVYSQYVTGMRSFSDLVRIRTELASRQDDLERVRSMRTGLLGRLASMLDLPPDTVFGEITRDERTRLELDTNSLINNITETSPELAGLSAGIEKMEAMIAMTELRADPDATFGFTYFQGRDTEAMSFMNRPMVDYRNGNSASDQAWAIELRIRRDAMEEMLSARRNMLAGMLGMQVEKYLQAGESSGVSSGRIIPSAQAALDVVRTGYTADANSFNDLIMAELTLLMARMELAGHEMDRRVAHSEIERMAGYSIGLGNTE